MNDELLATIVEAATDILEEGAEDIGIKLMGDYSALFKYNRFDESIQMHTATVTIVLMDTIPLGGHEFRYPEHAANYLTKFLESAIRN